MNKIGSIGASLYVPTTHKNLLKIADGHMLGELRSLIFCTEDAVGENELDYALVNLSMTLKNMVIRPFTKRFVRVRNPLVLKLILDMPGSNKLSGFVIPKATTNNFDSYFNQIRKSHFKLMPTLETVEVFDESEMKLFRKHMERPGVRDHILALRIGGNDLLALLGIRRPRNVTIYRTPLGSVISKLVTTFRPYGFSLTAPVFEHLDRGDLLAQEVAEDIVHGMLGKTAIHPDQVALIESHYRVEQSDIEVAMKIIDMKSPAVFKMNESMCEIATHHDWALSIVEQARIFGLHQTELVLHDMTTLGNFSSN